MELHNKTGAEPMKAILIKSLLPPLFFFILYLNLNFFVFSFAAKEGYLNKRLKKADKNKSELEREIKPLLKDKRLKTYEDLSNKLKKLQQIQTDIQNQSFDSVNIYEEFNKNKLVLLSEQSISAENKEFKNLTNFTVTGDYNGVIETLKAISKSELIPVRFLLNGSLQEKTKYTISVWNKNEQL